MKKRIIQSARIGVVVMVLASSAQALVIRRAKVGGLTSGNCIGWAAGSIDKC